MSQIHQNELKNFLDRPKVQRLTAKGVPEASKSDFWSPKGEGSLEDGVGSLEDGVGSLEAAVRVSGSRGTFWSNFGFMLG